MSQEEFRTYREVTISRQDEDELKKKDATLRIQEDQVQEIIKLLAEEFSIDNGGDENNSGGSESKETGDTGFDEARSDEKDEKEEETGPQISSVNVHFERDEAVSSDQNEEPYNDDTGSNNDIDYVNMSRGGGGDEYILDNSDRNNNTKLTMYNISRQSTELVNQSINEASKRDREEDLDEDETGVNEEYSEVLDEALMNENEFVDEEERKAYFEVVEFVLKAKDFGANALDLSKKKLRKLPPELLDLSSLQVT
jgi:hypothetical protein